MRLADLVAALGPASVTGDLDTAVLGLAADSRQVQPGYVFIAVKGATVDAHQFIPEAVARGAVGVVCEGQVDIPPHVAKIVVPSGRWALSALADCFYSHPARKLDLVGITGTNGKTTIAFLIKQLAEACQVRPGVIGTAGMVVGSETIAAKSGYTTPEALTLHRLLREMVQMGARLVAMEVTSHALEQDRVAHCPFPVAVYTNLTHEHLDYHQDMESYFQAKARLFRELRSGSAAVINIDCPYGQRMRLEVPDGVQVLTYSLNDPSAALRAVNLYLTSAGGTAFDLVTPAGTFPVTAPNLFGHYNVSNALAAVGAGMALGWAPDVIAAALQQVKPAPGRFQRVDRGQPFSVIVDYAHTPDGFRQLLSNMVRLKPVGSRIIMVFGSAGHRDRTKRPDMGRIAGTYADLLVLTEEDPRTESAMQIAREIAGGVDNPACQVELIEDRVAAIRHAIHTARTSDIVLITGKGNETELEVLHPTDWHGDVPAAEAALAELRKAGGRRVASRGGKRPGI